MDIGVPTETKDSESRVALAPAGAAVLVAAGHRVRVQRGAGIGSGFADAEYSAAGAMLCDAADAWGSALVVKVKEPLPTEYRFLRGQMLFTYLHLAGVDPALTQALLASGTVGIGYETVRDDAGHLPLLAPMSAIAGNMAVAVGTWYLAKPHGGIGVQLGRVLGEPHGRVLVVGDGVVGQHAAASAAALGAEVIVYGIDAAHGAALLKQLPEHVNWRLSTPQAITVELPQADLLIGAVLLPGARAPHLISADMVRKMRPGTVIVDVSIDQGGCVETARPTSHSDPVYTVDGVLHYCVTNMPGAYPRTATVALTQATLPYLKTLAGGGRAALFADPALGAGVNTLDGYVTCPAAAQGLGLLARHRPLAELAP
ncbi:alanine dehydrogenase [Immundisolibacter sp.]|uniref:alanine dehydrogenase n=1 Tax=Immundisolibacter sp. TaxID=1934948 RepID=UPI0035659B57